MTNPIGKSFIDKVAPYLLLAITVLASMFAVVMFTAPLGAFAGHQSLTVIALAGLVLAGLALALLLHTRREATRQQQWDKALMEQALGGLIILSPQGEIRQWNQGAAELTGYRSEKSIGRNLFDVLRFKQGSHFNSEVLQLIASGQELRHVNLTVLDAEPQPRPLSLDIFPLIAAHPGRKGKDEPAIVVTLRDIGEERRLEHRMKNAHSALEAQLRANGAELEKARRLAMSARQVKDEFITNISHEVRTPIHGIFGMLRLLRQDPLTERQEHRLLMAESSVNELTDLINGILDIAKIEAEKLEMELTEVHLPTIIHNAVTPYALEANNRQIDLIVDCAEVSDRYVLGDPARIGQIFHHLIDNALKYTHEGQVLISAKTIDKGDSELMLSCSVADSGIGISPEAQAQLFEPFFRGDLNSSTERKGSGIGLAIASQLCKLMDGDLMVSSRKGMGSRFNFSLRLEAAAEQSGKTGGISLDKRTAVVVDPNSDSARASEKWLQKNGADTAVFATLADIDVPLAERADILLIDSDSYEKHQKMIQGLQAGRTKGRPMRVLVTAATSSHATTMRSRFGPGTALLERPVTGISLEESLFSVYGIQRRKHPDPKDISDAEKQYFWNKLANLKVLIVDDNRINQKVVGGMLEEYGVQVAYAETGEAAIDTLKATTDHPFDLIFMDCQMPVMNGYDATRRIRAGMAGFQYIHVPIIAVTAGAMAGDRMKCLESGMTDYITKPIQPHELERKILSLELEKRGAMSTDDTQPQIDTEHPRDTTAACGLPLEVEQALNKHPLWDKEGVMKRLMNRADILDTVIDMYQRTSPDVIDYLKQAIAASEYSQIKALAHDLKGISENVGAKKVGYLCFELELAAMDKQNDVIEHLSHSLFAQIDQLLEILRAHQDTTT